MQRVAIVGGGPAGVIAYVMLRHRGLSSDEITVFDEHQTPLETWRGTTAAIAQERMRSESDGHFFPTDFPGFALMDALHSLSPVPLLRSAVNRYHPSLSAVLENGSALARYYGMDGSMLPICVARISRDMDPEPHFVVYDRAGNPHGAFRHVLLALGHGPLRWPDACRDEAIRQELDGVLYHAYQSKPPAGPTTAIIGGGMAAVTEWINALRQGATVIAMHRSAQLIEQPLSAPRCTFAGPWLDRYHALGADERADVLKDLARGTSPRLAGWKGVLAEAEARGRLRHVVAEVDRLTRLSDGRVEIAARTPSGARDVLTCDMVVAATGFQTGWQAHEVLRRLVADHDLQTYQGHLVVGGDCAVPGVSAPGSVLTVSGPAAAWAYPAADSFAAMKYAARRFALHALGGSARRPAGLRAWAAMVRHGWPYRSAAQRSQACASR